MKKSNVYTRTGDNGTSSLYNGERRYKNDIIFNTIGSIDELSCFVGLANEYLKQDQHDMNIDFYDIQHDLNDIMACIATPKDSDEKKIQYTVFDADKISKIELWIDTIDSQLPPLKNFIFPSGGFSSCQLHICRSKCRSVERKLTTLYFKNELDSSILHYINRLSDLFFVCARKASLFTHNKEIIYKK